MKCVCRPYRVSSTDKDFSCSTFLCGWVEYNAQKPITWPIHRACLDPNSGLLFHRCKKTNDWFPPSTHYRLFQDYDPIKPPHSSSGHLRAMHPDRSWQKGRLLGNQTVVQEQLVIKAAGTEERMRSIKPWNCCQGEGRKLKWADALIWQKISIRLNLSSKFRTRTACCFSEWALKQYE